MKEIKSILKYFRDGQGSGEKCALAQVVRVEGSSYRREGARMIVFESGNFEGGISGGCLEGDALKRSQLAILKQEPAVVTYDTSKELELGVGLGCNGIIDVLLTPISTDSDNIRILEKCTSNRRTHIVVTITDVNGDIPGVELGRSFYFDTEKESLEGMEPSDFKTQVLEKVNLALAEKKSRSHQFTSEDAELTFHVEYVPAQYHLAIYGDNYDVYPLIQMASLLDWEISLVGNVQKLKKEALSNVRNIYPKSGSERPKLDDRTACVLMAHDFKTDVENMMRAICSAAPYIASLGPKKRYEKIKTKLAEKGFVLDGQNEARIHAPCGLEIGADSPEEIALSICSEIISSFTGKEGGMLRNKLTPIHDRD